MGSIFGGKKGPSQAEIAAAQEKAAQRERDRMEREAAAKKLQSETKAVADLQAAESKRRAFAGQLSGEQDEEQRRKFLKGA